MKSESRSSTSSSSPSWSEFGKRYLLSVMAASVAETVTFPLDLAKTRMQIQGEAVSSGSRDGGFERRKRGLFRTAVGICKEEGFFKLWQGVTPGVFRHVIYTGIRISCYDKLRQLVAGRSPHHGDQQQLHLHHRIVCGMISGGFAQFCASPTDLVKVRMQMEGQRLLQGQKPKTMVQVLSEVVKGGGGVRGLWKGCVPNVQRAALVNLGDLTGYDQAKKMLTSPSNYGLGLSPESKVTHALASIVSGLVAATMGTPADVIKTRVMNQPLDKQTGKGIYYRGSVDCLIKTVRLEGLMALYKGFVPIWLRMAPWSMTFWLSFEQFRIIFGLQTW